MPRYNVEHNGKWACFSSITDSFITEFMDKNDYEEWRKIEYGLYNYKPVEKCNMITIDEAIHSIRYIRNRDETIECLLECGLSKEECGKLINDIERKYYYPILQEDGTYICPNCEAVVIKGQEICNRMLCNGIFCDHELIWEE